MLCLAKYEAGNRRLRRQYPPDSAPTLLRIPPRIALRSRRPRWRSRFCPQAVTIPVRPPASRPEYHPNGTPGNPHFRLHFHSKISLAARGFREMLLGNGGEIFQKERADFQLAVSLGNEARSGQPEISGRPCGTRQRDSPRATGSGRKASSRNGVTTGEGGKRGRKLADSTGFRNHKTGDLGAESRSSKIRIEGASTRKGVRPFAFGSNTVAVAPPATGRPNIGRPKLERFVRIRAGFSS